VEKLISERPYDDPTDLEAQAAYLTGKWPSRDEPMQTIAEAAQPE